MRSPFSFSNAADAAQAGAGFLNPPDWMVDETQQRLLLLINHVLAREPEAMRRLVLAQGRTLTLRWGRFWMGLVVTPAGLFDRVLPLASASRAPDLSFELAETSPWALARIALRGERPPLRIEGDVLFASDINWLVDHVRWDIEDDLSRLIGDAPARALGRAAQSALQALRRFVAKKR